MNKRHREIVVNNKNILKGLGFVALGTSWWMSVGQWWNYYPVANGYSVGWTLLYIIIGSLLWRT